MWTLIPWRSIFLWVAIGAVLATAFGWIKTKEHEAYAAGVAEVTNRWNAAEQGRRKLADEEAQRARTDAAQKQAAVDREAQAHAEALSRAQARIDALAADGDRLRAMVRTIAGAHRDPAPAAAAPTRDADGAAVAFGGLLESCSLLAERLGSQAEGLADQLRGLQAYVQTVTEPDGIKPPRNPDGK